LPTGIRMYVESQLHDRGRKIRSYTPFFRLDGTLLTNGLIRKTAKPIPTKKTIQLIMQPIPIGEKKKRNRR
jgi:hypothetical protein